MTWFLKSKIKASMQKIKQLEKEINKEAQRYNTLVREFQFENSMPTLDFGQQTPEELPPLEKGIKVSNPKPTDGFEL